MHRPENLGHVAVDRYNLGLGGAPSVHPQSIGVARHRSSPHHQRRASVAAAVPMDAVQGVDVPQ